MIKAKKQTIPPAPHIRVGLSKYISKSDFSFKPSSRVFAMSKKQIQTGKFPSENSDKNSIRFPIHIGKGGKSEKSMELYLHSLQDFANDLIKIQNKMDFHLGARGWCYVLEPKGLSKTDFIWMQKQINRLRDLGFIKPGFILDDEGHDVEEYYDSEQLPEDYFKEKVDEWENAEDYFKESFEWYDTSFWEDKKYYIQLLVEKIDLKSLFMKVCKQYRINNSNMHGQGSYEQKAKIAYNFMKAEERGQIPILLTCTDFDVAGLQIGEQRVWFEKHQKFTGWNPKNLIVDRIGLSYNFIQKHKLTWIDGLGTSGKNEDGSQKDLANPKHPHYNRQAVQDYLKNYCTMEDGTITPKKCEANAIVVVPKLGRQLLIKAIEKYLGKDVYKKFEEKIQKGKEEVKKLIDDELQNMKGGEK